MARSWELLQRRDRSELLYGHLLQSCGHERRNCASGNGPSDVHVEECGEPSAVEFAVSAPESTLIR